MKSYWVEYLDAKGSRRLELLRTGTPTAARGLIRRRGCTFLGIAERQPISRRQRERLSVPVMEAAAYLDQVAMQVEAGFPVDEALHTTARQMSPGRLQSMAIEIADRVSKDGRLEAAFAEFPKVFAPHLVQMISIGHQSGRLAETFAEIAKHLTEQDEIRASVRKALQYPMMAGVVVGGVVVFLLGFVIPMFGRVFRDLDVPLPWVTAVCLKVSAGFTSYWGWAVLGCGAVVGLYLFLGGRRCLAVFDNLLIQLPVFGEILRLTIQARFCGNLKALYAAGISIQRALRICSGVSGNSVYDRALMQITLAVERGIPVGEALANAEAFPDLLVHSVKIGEKTNRLELVLEKMQGYFARKAREKSSEALLLIEPMMTIGLGLFVGGVAIALFYPLVRLSMSIKG